MSVSIWLSNGRNSPPVVSASIANPTRAVIIEDDDPQYRLTASSEQGGDATILEGVSADDEGTFTLDIDSHEGVTSADVTFTYAVSGDSPSDGLDAQTAIGQGTPSGVSTHPRSKLNIPIVNNRGRWVIDVTAENDADNDAETAKLTVHGIEFNGGNRGPGLNRLASKERSASIDVLEQGLPHKPHPPTVVPSKTADSRTHLDVSWTAIIANPPVSDYDVQYRKQGDTAWTAHAHTGTATTTTISGLVSDTAYEVQVLARNVNGDSPWSNSNTGRTHGPNRPPSFPDPASGSSSLVREVAENSAGGDQRGHPGCGHRPGQRHADLFADRLEPVRHQCDHRTDHRSRQR